MIKIVFVCLGNICRSPMAEFVFKDLVVKNNLEKMFLVESRATSYEEIGNDIHYGTKNKLIEQGITFEKRMAQRLEKGDYEKYDYIIGMEENNIKNIIKIVGEDIDNKVFKLLDFSKKSRDIADPWYTGNFDKTFNDIKEGCESFFKYLKNNNKI